MSTIENWFHQRSDGTSANSVSEPEISVEERAWAETKERLAHETVLISGNSNLPLTSKISSELGLPVGLSSTFFPDGEVNVQIVQKLRNKHVFIIQSTNPPAENLIELEFMVDAARRASAQEISVVIPYYGYARQDWKHQSRVSIAAAAVASILTYLGANRILTIDLHAEQTTGSVLQPWDSPYASYVLIPELYRLFQEIGVQDPSQEVVVISPDSGATKKVDFYAGQLGVPLATLPKIRKGANVNRHGIAKNIDSMAGRVGLIIDDMVDRGTTLVSASDMLLNEGLKQVYALATHGVLSDNAVQRLNSSSLSRVYITDTIDNTRKLESQDKFRIISVASMLAKAIAYIHTGDSIAENLIL